MSPCEGRAPLTVVQWTTGNVGRQAVAGVADDPGLRYVGCYAHSADKVGRDLGELAGIGALGVKATDDSAALLALKPDVVVYTPLHLDVDELAGILSAGINVVTSAEFLTGSAIGAEARARLEAAAQQGGVTLFGSGMNPGFAQLIAGVLSGICRRIKRVRVTESFDLSLFADDPNMDELPFGMPGDAPDLLERMRSSTAVFMDAVDVLADLLGVSLDEHRCTADFATATEDLDLPGRPIAAGQVAGIDLRWDGIVGGEPVVELHQRWVMGDRIEPPMPPESAYLIEIDGQPKVSARIDLLPHHEDLSLLTMDDLHEIGMRITAMPLVYAIPAACAAAPGITTYAGLPAVVSGRVHAH